MRQVQHIRNISARVRARGADCKASELSKLRNSAAACIGNGYTLYLMHADGLRLVDLADEAYKVRSTKLPDGIPQHSTNSELRRYSQRLTKMLLATQL